MNKNYKILLFEQNMMQIRHSWDELKIQILNLH
jgi:hypothetical protein